MALGKFYRTHRQPMDDAFLTRFYQDEPPSSHTCDRQGYVAEELANGERFVIDDFMTAAKQITYYFGPTLHLLGRLQPERLLDATMCSYMKTLAANEAMLREWQSKHGDSEMISYFEKRCQRPTTARARRWLERMGYQLPRERGAEVSDWQQLLDAMVNAVCVERKRLLQERAPRVMHVSEIVPASSSNVAYFPTTTGTW